eukprot:g1766.t1
MDAFERTVAELSETDPTRLLESARGGSYLPSVVSNMSSESKSAIPAMSMNGKLPMAQVSNSVSMSSVIDSTKHPSGVIPNLQNVVSTCSFGCKLDLKRIALHARNAEYNPKRFAAVIMRIRDPKTTALIFSSGKMVCTGAKSEQDSRLASRKYAKIVMKLGYQVIFQDFKIQNIVGSCDVKFPIGLEFLHMKHNLFSRYEPELFPGLIYKMKAPKVVLLVFVSGKVVLTGAKTRNEIYQAFENIYPALNEFRKGKSGNTSRDLTTKAESTGRIHPSLSTQLQSDSHVSGERRIDVDNKSFSKMSASMGPMSMSQSIKGESKIWINGGGGSHEYHPTGPVQTDSFHSRFSPFHSKLHGVNSTDIGFNLQHSTTMSPPITSCPPPTPGFNLPPPPTPQYKAND